MTPPPTRLSYFAFACTCVWSNSRCNQPRISSVFIYGGHYWSRLHWTCSESLIAPQTYCSILSFSSLEHAIAHKYCRGHFDYRRSGCVQSEPLYHEPLQRRQERFNVYPITGCRYRNEWLKCSYTLSLFESFFYPLRWQYGQPVILLQYCLRVEGPHRRPSQAS